MLTVEKAAIKMSDGLVISVDRPGRHGDVIYQIVRGKIADRVESKEIQGFMLSDGRFVNRQEAAKVAFSAGQINKRMLERRGLDPEKCPEDLYSEDVW